MYLARYGTSRRFLALTHALGTRPSTQRRRPDGYGHALFADIGKTPRPNGVVHDVASCNGSDRVQATLRDGVSADLSPVTCHLDTSRNAIAPPTIGGSELGCLAYGLQHPHLLPRPESCLSNRRARGCTS
jgi:hypothetical protein